MSGRGTFNIDDLLRERKIIITCGTGGVGKTTVSAALALRAALIGKKAIVITIDPAKRLATSLGLDLVGNHPTDLTAQIRNLLDEKKSPGSFSALMPDTKHTFENFVRTLAPNPALAEKVFKNPIFQIFAKEFSGTNEYMALQQLYSLNEAADYDCIILDTPPSRNTLAFLNAPLILSQFLDERVMRWLVMPANKLVAGTMRKALGLLEKLTGAGFMTNLFDFAAALFEVRVGFTANLKKITALLESEEVGFLLVGSAAPENAKEIGYFVNSVHEHGFHFKGLVINRTVSYLRPPAGKADSGDEALELIAALQAREKESVDLLFQTVQEHEGARSKNMLYVQLPELARDVHSVEDLVHVALAFDGPDSL